MITLQQGTEGRKRLIFVQEKGLAFSGAIAHPKNIVNVASLKVYFE